MNILVNGLMEYGAGKTSVVRAILLRASEVGEKFFAFKPKSAHNYWEHIDHSLMCASRGKLVSRDALLFHEMGPNPPPIELTNPYHQLICPIDLMKARDRAEHLLEGSHDLILAERLTHPNRGTVLFVNRRADVFVAPEDFLAALKRGADMVEMFQTSPVAEGMASVEECVRAAYEALAGEGANLVIESFSDTPFPLELREDEIDLVVSVGGSLVLFYEPREVLKAIEAVGSRTMADLVKYLCPTSTFRVSHLRSEERADGGALVAAYDEILRHIMSRL